MSNELLTVVEEGILVVTLNRPEARNAINRAAAQAIAEAMEELDSNPDLRLAIFTGGNDTFCSPERREKSGGATSVQKLLVDQSRPFKSVPK